MGARERIVSGAWATSAREDWSWPVSAAIHAALIGAGWFAGFDHAAGGLSLSLVALVLGLFLFARTLPEFARTGGVDGLITLATGLVLMVLSGLVGLVLGLVALCWLWLGIPRDIGLRHWPHTYLPVLFPAILVVGVQSILVRRFALAAGQVALPGTLDAPVSAPTALGVAVLTVAFACATAGRLWWLRDRRDGEARAALAHAALAVAAIGFIMISVTLALACLRNGHWAAPLLASALAILAALVTGLPALFSDTRQQGLAR